MTNEFKHHIRTDMPPPKPRSGLVTLFREMPINASVLIDKRYATSIGTSARAAGIAVRRKTEQDGIRVWRVE